MSETAGVWVGCLLMIGLGTLGYQTYIYLHYGSWLHISMIDFLKFFETSSSWLNKPDTWFGLHEVLAWTPSALFFIGIAALIWWVNEY